MWVGFWGCFSGSELVVFLFAVRVWWIALGSLLLGVVLFVVIVGSEEVYGFYRWVIVLC